MIIIPIKKKLWDIHGKSILANHENCKIFTPSAVTSFENYLALFGAHIKPKPGAWAGVLTNERPGLQLSQSEGSIGRSCIRHPVQWNLATVEYQ